MSLSKEDLQIVRENRKLHNRSKTKGEVWESQEESALKYSEFLNKTEYDAYLEMINNNR